MTTRLEDVPVIKISPVTVSAPVYNRLRLAAIRLDNPFRVALSGLKGMDFLIDDNSWICVDRTLYDLPILAWTSFETSGRENLHAPVHCQLHYYHIHANVIAETVLNTVEAIIEERLRPAARTEPVVDFHTHLAAKIR